jgi:hypothetical protein
VNEKIALEHILQSETRYGNYTNEHSQNVFCFRFFFCLHLILTSSFSQWFAFFSVKQFTIFLTFQCSCFRGIEQNRALLRYLEKYLGWLNWEVSSIDELDQTFDGWVEESKAKSRNRIFYVEATKKSKQKQKLINYTKHDWKVIFRCIFNLVSLVSIQTIFFYHFKIILFIFDDYVVVDVIKKVIAVCCFISFALD